MSRMIGTVSRGVRAPIIRSGDDIVEIVTNSVLEASADAGFEKTAFLSTPAHTASRMRLTALFLVSVICPFSFPKAF